MPIASGCLKKMRTTPGQPVQYQLVIGDELVELNPYIGGSIELSFSGRIECVNCSRSTKKSFNQGYCYPCFKKLAECDQCVMSPEKCHFHEGTCRDPEWGKKYCMQGHTVYLANSSSIKVGITRDGQLPTRWIDQGAIQGVPVIQTATRQLAGFAEDAIREYVSDRTQWQTMLKGKIDEMDLKEEWSKLLPQVSDKLQALQQAHGAESIKINELDDITRITFPVIEHPEKVKSLNFDKTPEVSGKLMGIKGQYLILDSGVINIRKFTAYEIEFDGTKA